MSSVGSSSSFQRKGKARVVAIPGTRPSIHNSQLLLSSGLPSLDHLFGGGIPVGSLVLLEQDRHDVYSKLFLKYYLAEGIMCGHLATLASLDDRPESIMATLPGPTDREVDDEATAVQTDRQMTIAWRYQNQSTSSQPASTTKRFGHGFDLTLTMDSDLVGKVDTCLFDGSKVACGKDGYYWALLQCIAKQIADNGLSTASNKAKANVMRIAVHSLASPLWGMEFSRAERDHQWGRLTTCLYGLRALVRSSLSVCLVTVPSHLFHDIALTHRLHALSDFVVRLESFQGSDKETNPVFKDYHGLFHVVKVAAINSLVPPLLDTSDWVFKLRRRRMTIERLHLPPDLSETASRAQEDTLGKTKGMSCMGDKLPRNLDF